MIIFCCSYLVYWRVASNQRNHVTDSAGVCFFTLEYILEIKCCNPAFPWNFTCLYPDIWQYTHTHTHILYPCFTLTLTCIMFPNLIHWSIQPSSNLIQVIVYCCYVFLPFTVVPRHPPPAWVGLLLWHISISTVLEEARLHSEFIKVNRLYFVKCLLMEKFTLMTHLYWFTHVLIFLVTVWHQSKVSSQMTKIILGLSLLSCDPLQDEQNTGTHSSLSVRHKS